VFLALLGVQHHDDQISRLANGYDLATATLASGCAFDDTWQVKQLQLGSVNEELAWDTGQRCELIGCHLRVLRRNQVQEGRLAHRWEPNHGDASVTMLLHVEAFAFL
jgi:hypothetical protein